MKRHFTYFLAAGLFSIFGAFLPVFSVHAETVSLSEFTAFGDVSYADSTIVSAGDVNNDGYNDVLISNPYDNTAGEEAGAVYLVYGSALPISNSSLSTAVKFTGEAAGDLAGWSVSGAGDVNNDGYDDMLIGAKGQDAAGSSAGAAYLVYGSSSLASASLSTSTAVKFTGEAAFDFAGFSVSGAGDVNNDGYDDMLIGAHGNDAAGSSAGAAYLVYGSSSLTSVSLSTSTAVKFTGEAAGDNAGYSISGAGDVNNDGYDDMLIGASLNDAAGLSAGAAYLVYGSSSLSSASLSAAVKFTGEYGSYAGASVSIAGDVNNDGYDDMLVGAYGAESSKGAAYLVYGSSSLSSASLSAAVKFTGEAASDFSAFSVSTAGDVNNDGYDDMLVGAYGNDAAGSAAGAAYLVYGSSSLTSVSLSTSTAVKFTGEVAGDLAGSRVSSAGDVNNDGHDEIFVLSNGSLVTKAYLGYVFIDKDQDGYVHANSVLTTSDNVDCDDNDASQYSTYYQDADNDGFGSSLASVCRGSSAPTGFVTNNEDLDDAHASVYPGASEVADGLDNDQDGTIDEGTNVYDDDGDGVTENAGDCDDSNASLTSATLYYLDSDADSYGNASIASYFCSLTPPTGYVANSNDPDDSNATIYFGAPELEDGLDNDQDGTIDEGTNAYDDDGDGVTENEGDCDDSNASVGATYYDNDHDGLGGAFFVCTDFEAIASVGQVLNSSDSNDNDYDNDGVTGGSWGGADCDDTNASLYTLYYNDQDGDGFGNTEITECLGENSDAFWVVDSGDENDSYATVYPEAPELEDGLDNDQDGTIDEGTNAYDDDGDGVTENAGDCDDSNSAIYILYYADDDNDGFGNPAVLDCQGSTPSESLWVLNSDDPDDAHASVYPGASEIADGLDNDQDGTIDEGTNAYDDDGDGVTENEGDCDDANAELYQLIYLDGDSDGYGSDSVSMCVGYDVTEGYVSTSATIDCDDANPDVFIVSQFYRDADSDGNGSGADVIEECTNVAPDGYVSNSHDTNDNDYDNDGVEIGTDCNDTDSSLTSLATYYRDSDGDTYGSASSAISSCSLSVPTGYVTNSSDVDDADSSVTTTSVVTAPVTSTSTTTTGSSTGTSTTSETTTGNTSTTSTTGTSSSTTTTGNSTGASTTSETVSLQEALVSEDTVMLSEDVLTVVSIVPQKKGKILVTYSDSSSQTVTVFPKSKKAPKASLSSDGQTIIVLSANGKKIKILSAFSGEVLDFAKVAKKKQKNIQLSVQNFHADLKDEVVIVGKTKKGLRTTVFSLSQDTGILSHKHFKVWKKRVKSIKKFKIQADVQTSTVQLTKKNGKKIVAYSISESGSLVKK